MSLHRILLIVQVFLSILLMVTVLLQSQGSSSGMLWGASNQSYHTRRGFEKILHYFTYVGVTLFIIIGILILRTT